MGRTDGVGAPMIEDGIERIGGGQITLDDPPQRIVAALTDLQRRATSWVLVTHGRIPPEQLALMGRDDLAELAVTGGCLVGAEIAGRSVALNVSGFAHYLSSSTGDTEMPFYNGQYTGTAKTPRECMNLVARQDGYHPVRGGVADRSILAPSTVDLDGEHHTALDFTKWMAAAFRASWIVRMRRHATPDSVGGWRMWPTLDMDTLGDLFGVEAATRHLISPDLPDMSATSIHWIGGTGITDARVVRAEVRRTVDGADLASDVWVDPAQPRDPGFWGRTKGQAREDLLVMHPNNAGNLDRYHRRSSEVTLATLAQLDAAAERVLERVHQPVDQWDVTLSNPTQALALPLGAPVGLLDIRAGVADVDHTAYIGALGAAPVLGCRVTAKTWPFAPGMGAYVALAGEGDSWAALDISDWVQPEDGSVTVGRTVGSSSLAQAFEPARV